MAIAILPLSKAQDRQGFSCGEPALDEYLKRKTRRGWLETQGNYYRPHTKKIAAWRRFLALKVF